MRYAILGDVHANWEALSAVLDDAKHEGVDAYACVGDVVGYNSDPVRCLECLREHDCAIVRGNHDHYSSHPISTDGMSDAAAAAVRWTRRQLGPDHIAFLRDLPYVMKLDDFELVHNTLDAHGSWDYVFDTRAAERHFTHQETPVCFHGHTHVPVVFRLHRRVTLALYDTIKLGRGTRYFINVGSVGQPRDRTPKSAYVLFDTDARSVTLRRVPYDISITHRKILSAGLPEWLGVRLLHGM